MPKKRDIVKELLKYEKEEIDIILADVERLKEKLIEKRPGRFGPRDLVNAFFASLLIVTTFIFKGSFIKVSQALTLFNIGMIIASTCVLLTAQIYFISYTRVANKPSRPFFQFWIKRFFSLYVVAILVSIFLTTIYGLSHFVTGEGYVKLIIALSLPAAICAAVPSLMKKF